MEDISLHILDIAENAISAGSSRIEIEIIEDSQSNLMSIKIKDDGKGMDEEVVKSALDPFYTSKPGKRIGLGIPLLAQAARESGGMLKLKSEPAGGTVITATFQLTHPDRKPLGDIPKTVYLLKVTHPEIDFIYNLKKK